jgi:hypothetical protein
MKKNPTIQLFDIHVEKNIISTQKKMIKVGT